MHKNLSPLRWDSHSFYLVVITADKHLVEENERTTKRTRNKDKPVRKQQKRTRSKDTDLLENNKLRLSTQPKGHRSRWPRWNLKQRLF